MAWNYTLKTRISRILILLSLPLLLGAASKSPYIISGVKGKLLTNIQTRLDELAQSNSLFSESNDSLIQQVEKAMQPYGYFKPRIQLKGQNKEIIIQAGPQMIINELSLEIKGDGRDNLELIKTIDELPIKQGKPLNSAKYEEAKDNLVNVVEHQGYLRSFFEKSELVIDTSNYTARIHLIFNTGPRFYFGQVIFDPTYISPDLLKRYIPFQWGQPYTTEQILLFNNRLRNSGYFSSVTVDPHLDRGHEIPIDVHLLPAKKVTWSLGLGYGTDTGLRGRAGFHINPVNRAGHKFNAVALGSFKQNALQAQYIIPGNNPVVNQYTITGNATSLDYDSGHSNSILLALAQQHNKTRFQRLLSINALHERFRYSYQSPEEKTTVFPKASFTWKKTDDKLFSPSGYNFNINALAASRHILADENFSQLVVNAKAALTIDNLRTRFYFHTIQGITEINDINQLPLSLALLLGGAENLKGYSFNSIGPGKVLGYGGIEIQKETIDHWYLVGFFDTGDVYKPGFKQTQNDIGGGLMWVSPVGPIKVGLAQPVNNRFQSTEKTPRFVVSMGPDL